MARSPRGRFDRLHGGAAGDTGRPAHPWAGAGKLPPFYHLINRVLDRVSAGERVTIGIHTCSGGDRDSVQSADVPYSSIWGTMFDLNASYILIQLASEWD